jgi:hypothetical protein
MGWYSNSYLPERYAREEEEQRIDLIIDEIDQLQHENNNFTIVEENEPSIVDYDEDYRWEMDSEYEPEIEDHAARIITRLLRKNKQNKQFSEIMSYDITSLYPSVACDIETTTGGELFLMLGNKGHIQKFKFRDEDHFRSWCDLMRNFT